MLGFSISPGLCQSYLSALIDSALERSTPALEAEAALTEAEAEFRKDSLSWMPVVSIDSPDLAFLSRSGPESVIVVDALPEDGHTDIAAGSLGISINQRLPGSGSASLQLGQQTEYAVEYKAWRQDPSVRFSLSQPLGPGAFGVGTDPAKSEVALRVEIARLGRRRSTADILVRAISVVSTLDIAERSLAAAEANRAAKAAHLAIARAKAAQGTISASDLWKAGSEAAAADRQREKALFDRDAAADDWIVFFGVAPRPVEDADRLSLLMILSSARDDATSLSAENVDRQEAAYEASRRIDLIGRAPALSFSFSAAPDPASHYFTSNWSDSWATLRDGTTPLSISAGLGIKYPLPLYEARKAEDLARDAAIGKFRAEKADTIASEDARRIRGRAMEERLRDYLAILDGELSKDAALAKDRETLVTRGEMTEEDDLAAKVVSLQLVAEKVSATWELMRDIADRLALGGVDPGALFGLSHQEQGLP